MDPIQAKIALAEEQIRVLTQQRDHERNPEQKVACTNEIAGIHNHIADMRNERTALITQQAPATGYVISDIWRSLKKGDLIRAANAAFDTSPYETIVLASAVLLPPTICCYGDYFVPWRHERWPYTTNQLMWRNRIGASLLRGAGNKRVIFGVALTAWALDKFRRSLSTMKSKT